MGAGRVVLHRWAREAEKGWAGDGWNEWKRGAFLRTQDNAGQWGAYAGQRRRAERGQMGGKRRAYRVGGDMQGI